jgi:hypothetical protein
MAVAEVLARQDRVRRTGHSCRFTIALDGAKPSE